MKQEMMIVGVRVPDGNAGEMLEIELVPLLNMKKKVNLLELQNKLISGADMQTVLSEHFGAKQYRTKIYVSRVFCSEHMILPFQSCTIEFNLSDTTGEKI